VWRVDLGSGASINPWAVLLAAAATFAVGGLWYSPLLFNRPWQRLAGLSDQQLRASSPARVFGLSFVAALVAAVNLAFFLSGPATTLAFASLAGCLVGGGWVATALATTYLFERRPLGLWLIDAGYHLVAFTLMGAILGAWR
jgi:hypothetical protein